jgi:hypothetical protein
MMLLAQKLERELAEGKNKYLQVCAQQGRLVDQVFEEDGETLKHIAAEAELATYRLWAEVEIADLRDDVKRLNAELAALQNAFENEVTAREQAESRLRDSCLEGRGDQEFPPCGRAIEAEARAAAAYDLLREVLDWGLPEDLKERIDDSIGEKK